MQASLLFSTFRRRLLIGSVLWLLFWPVFWYFRIGDITGAKSWFWIVGELNYPIAVIVFYLIDSLVRQWVKSGAKCFLLSTLLTALVMPFFYQRFGFSMAVLLEAVLFSFGHLQACESATSLSGSASISVSICVA